MTGPTEKRDLASLRLKIEDRETLIDCMGEAIAVQVYRELKAIAAASEGGNIFGNCCSCSRAEM